MTIKVPEDLAGLPDDKLNTLWEELASYREELRLQAQRVNEERNSRLDLQAARDKLLSMNSAERQALAQLIGTEGIESLEDVGETGAPANQVVQADAAVGSEQ